MARFYLPLLLTAFAAQPTFAQDEEGDPLEAHQAVSLGYDEKAVVTGLNLFGAELYAQLRSEPGSVIVSPASVSTAFGLAYAGARGRTAEEIAATLHYPLTLSDFHGSFGKLLGTMRLERLGRTLTINNAIWLRTGLRVHQEYASLVERNYGAGLQRVDFGANAARALQTINGWVEAKTNNRIRNLLSPYEVNTDTRSVLVNTVYFKADWREPFKVAATKVEAFRPLAGTAIKQPLMHHRERFGYAEKDGAKALILPYRGGETEMVVLLPPSNSQFAKFEASLTEADWADWIERANANWYDTIVTLPKFKVEKRYEIVPTLKALGMVTPFGDSSDFSGMKPVNNQSHDLNEWNLKISHVIHQVFVEVEEKGTEAAAATAIVQIMITGARRDKPPPPKIFRADRPFLFAIRDRRTAAILFLGRYTGPETAN